MLLSDRLRKSFRIFGNRTALLTTAGDRIDYGTLEKWQEHIRAALPSDPNSTPVGICLPKSPESVASILAATFHSRPYIPLDYDAPSERNAFILKDAGAGTLITTPEMADAILTIMDGSRSGRIKPGSANLEVIALSKNDNAPELPEDLAYLLYTSGSTGKPKGVMITHRNALCFVDWASQYFSVGHEDVLTSIAPFHFDLSVFDLYAGLLNGASVLLINAQETKNPMFLSEALEKYQVTITYATPTTLKLILRFGKLARYNHTKLRDVLFAGEVFAPEPLHELCNTWPHARFTNLYGPTETNVCTYYPVPNPPIAERTVPYPIGILCPYATGKLWMDGEAKNIQSNSEGELLIGGQSMMKGYLNLPERNAQCFVEAQDGTYYRTGDLVRVDADGSICYVNRIDRMIKRYGYRIELGEIEAAMRKIPSVSDGAVVSLVANTGDTRLIVFYTTTHGEEISRIDLQTSMQQILPNYMLPDEYTLVPSLPMTSTHKVNYQQLLEMACQ